MTAIDPEKLRGNPAGSSDALIRKVWAKGLDVLKPTTAQLEHGLELHRASMVIDTFGFLPMLWNDECTRRWNALIQEGISGYEFQYRAGLQREMAATYCQQTRELFFEAIHCAGLTGVIQTSASGQSHDSDIARLAGSGSLIRHMAPELGQMYRADDMVQAHADGRCAVGLSVNGPPVTSNLTGLEDESRWLETWYHLGVRMMHLTYNRRNVIATGCAERNDGGLSELGYEYIREMNRVGIIVDVPHSSELTTMQAAQTSTKPVMASHVGCKGILDHMRNKSDEALKAIAQTNGVVGIVARPSFLGPDASINTLLDHLDYAVKCIGVDHLAIGTDTTYVAEVPTDRLAAIPGSFTPRWWGAWSRQLTHNATTSDAHRTGSLAWTNWPLYTVGMVMRGYSDADIQKILGQNFVRVLKANEPVQEATEAAAQKQS